jgi:hypothetical protein
LADIVCYQTLQKPGPVMASDFKNMSIARIGHLSFRSFGHQRQSDICLDPLYMCAVWAVVIPLFVFMAQSGCLIWLFNLPCRSRIAPAVGPCSACALEVRRR